YPYGFGDMPEYHFLGTFPPFAIITGMALYEVFKGEKNRFITVFSLNVGFAVYSWSQYGVLPIKYGVFGALFSGLFIIALYPVFTSQLGKKLENMLKTQQFYQKAVYFFFFLILTFLAIKVRILNYLT
ncbi:MAG: hypothetical protein QME59_07170, partial [Candidatus Hydrothermarchaeota archaeon]|nr:hypothetical protein [Candidatus Hydrothermarchaeota archaeon]